MKRLNLLIVIFGIALVVPCSWLILQTYASLKQEEISQLRFFSFELFAQMEEDMAARIYREESRPVDAYQQGEHAPLSSGASRREEEGAFFFQPPHAPYIIGYFQNNPDGSFHSPYGTGKTDSISSSVPIERLKSINAVFNQRKYQLPDHSVPVSQPGATPGEEDIAESFSNRYISIPSDRRQKSYIGRKTKRMEEITLSQAANLSQNKTELEKESSPEALTQPSRALGGAAPLSEPASTGFGGNPSDSGSVTSDRLPPPLESTALKVEVTPFQGVLVDAKTLVIFRRVILKNQVYRQGFALDLPSFIEHLASVFFLSQPMVQFTRLSFSLKNGTRHETIGSFGVDIQKSEFNLAQTFPAPFDLLSVSLSCRQIPAATARTSLNYIATALFMVVLIGYVSIYTSVRSIVDLSKRRSRFVASVTHELKTPLTNIGLYIEMLEQGIARDKAKEKEYYQILSSECARLTHLIGNVLEFSRLEKKQHSFDLQKGDFNDVIEAVQAIFKAKLNQENYSLSIDIDLTRPFTYDKQVLIQILINLIENSLKFGRKAVVRDILICLYQSPRQTHISVSDSGPGIPSKAIKKVFDDFYRAEQADMQSIAGTGLGLALVKKFIIAMGGRVKAENRQQGCKITLTLPS